MKPIHLLLALALLFGGSAAAQNAMTPVVASQITLGGALISSGTISITPVDQQGTMLPLTTADGKFYLPGPISAPITAGAISGLTVPDQCTATFTTPNTPINMRVDIVQIVNGKPITATFISQAKAPFFCGSTAVAVDHYSPAQTAQASAAGIVSTPTVPAHCTSPSVYYPPTGNSPVVRVCIAGVFVAVNTSSDGVGSQLSWSGTWSSATAYTANQAVLRNGSTYVALQSSTNQDPATATLFWQLIAQKGSDGATGAGGASGQGLNLRGPWQANTSYVAYDVVTNGGQTYVASAPFTSGNSFNASNWTLMAQKGVDGTNGVDALVGSAAFASFPTTNLVANKTLEIQTDATATSACASPGGGLLRRLCVWNGSTWIPADNQVVLPSNAPSNQLSTASIIRYVASVTDTDDSYGAGVGASTYGTYGYGSAPTSFWGLLRRDVPTGIPMPNRAFTGWTMPQIVNDFFGWWYPPDSVLPSVLVAGGTENDLSGSTSADPIYLQNQMMFHDIWASVPQQFHVNAPNCTASSGWSIGDASPIAGSGTSTAIFWYTTGASKTLTCNVPSSNTGTVLWVKHKYLAAGTGAWTVTVDGTTTLTDNGTGTTTFSNAPPNSSVAAADVDGAEQFTITPGAHTVVFSTTASNASRVDIGGIAWAPPAWNPSTGQLGLPNQTVVFRRNTVNGIFANSATVNAAIATETAKLFAAGLPVFFEDLNSPVGGVAAMNSTTDYANTSLAKHFGDAGQLHWKQHFLATAQAYGFVFAAPNIGGGMSRDGIINVPISVRVSKCTLFTDCLSVWRESSASGDVGGGGCTYKQGGSLMCLRSGKDASTGKPYSGAYLQQLSANSGLAAGTAVAAEMTNTVTQAENNVTSHAVFRNNTGTLMSDTGITSSLVPAITSATTIAPTTASALVGGSAAIVTITPMADCTTTGWGCSLLLLPAAASTWTLATGGNIFASCTPTVGKPLLLYYLASASTPLWYPVC